MTEESLQYMKEGVTEDAHIRDVRRELSHVGSRWDCAAWTSGSLRVGVRKPT
jgi:hypothetical protein